MMNDLKVIPTIPLPELKERLFSYVENLSFLTDEDCWNWKGYTTASGYGVVSIKAVPYRVHRLSFWIFRHYAQGDFIVDSDKYLLHSCDNKTCINPSHLRIGTPQDNINDAKDRKRLASQKGETNGCCTTKVSKVLEVRRMYAEGYEQRSIARILKLDYKHVNMIVLRKIWKHV
jgi:hypothetical protein